MAVEVNFAATRRQIRSTCRKLTVTKGTFYKFVLIV
jgi:hypothetical protein